ncbi:MAG: transglutaminase domain-containing protein [Candidatus Dormibacteria bacterium]
MSGPSRRVRVGCEFGFEPEVETLAVIQVQPRTGTGQRVIEETLGAEPPASFHHYDDLFHNLCQRWTIPAGEARFRYEAVIEVAAAPDAVDLSAQQSMPLGLPDECLVYTQPSRYCHSDALADDAWKLFGSVKPGWGRVQAICDWVHSNIAYESFSSTPATTAVDVFENRVGVCRDFAHLAVSFCRALNVPARYVFGYLPDIGWPAEVPMDFSAWFEAYLGDRWWTFDARHNVPRVGRVVVGRGRDAVDVAMVTTYGQVPLIGFRVWADELR